MFRFSNKCNNEKRRREQENNYIEELAELISANIADMSTSVKPDKCAILQEAVNQIRSIKQETTTQSSDPVQQGEVSSSRPTILSNELYGPLLLEALEGFLFVINSEGKVIKDFLLNFIIIYVLELLDFFQMIREIEIVLFHVDFKYMILSTILLRFF